jgi:tRNA(Glu) U13 pseudouridine synthase TruD
MPEISSAGVFRQIAVTPKNPNVSPVISNSIYISNATFAFSLVRGSYGTIVLREFMKNDDPIAAGY